MNKKEFHFLEKKIEELVEHDIISSQQSMEARDFFAAKVKQGKSAGTILAGIGVLLIALSVITLFAVNWDMLSKSVKIGISFLPIMITAVMMYFCMDRTNKKMVLYTSIFAPASILATNSLIGQVFHAQTEIYELIFTSLLMFMPIVFVLRNYLALLVYAVGIVIYAFCAVDGMNETPAVLSIVVLALPMVIFNVINYVKNKEDKRNTLLWVGNVILFTLLIFYKEIVRPEACVIYVYLIYVLSRCLFKRETLLNRIIAVCLGSFLLISCISDDFVFFAEDITFGWDLLALTMITVAVVYLSKLYKAPKEYIFMGQIILLQYLKVPAEFLFYALNILTLVWGISKIVSGNKEGDVKELKRGIAIVLYLVFIRFMNADIGFLEKSVIFLISGLGFIFGARLLEKKMGGQKDE